MDRESVDRDRRLNRWALQSAARELMPREGVAFCLRRLGFDSENKRAFRDVRVMYAEHLKRAHYKHLFICGSVWMCPICAAKVSERRRIELTQAIENSDFHTALLTLTLQHSLKDSLESLLDVLLRSRSRLKSGRAWQNFVSDFGIVGTVSGLENTYGVNGHHPHSHNLLVACKPLDADRVRDRLYSLWLSALSERGKSASYDHGLDVQNEHTQLARYVSKFGREPKGGKARWTVAHELTKSVSKMSRGDHGMTPLELLQAFAGGDSRAGAVWKEYARVFKGRHQLQWSRGLRALLGLSKPESDLDIAERVEEPAVLLATLSLRQWQIVLGNDARGELLEVASSGDVECLRSFLSDLGA